MAKVVAFVGSPRKGGNTDRLVDEVLAGAAEAGHQTEKVYLADHDLTPIGPVQGDERSWTDDRQQVADGLIDRMIEADVVVLGSPVYWFSISGLMKLFVDRWALYHPRGRRLRDALAPSGTGGPRKRLVVALAMEDPRPGYLPMVFDPLRQCARWLGIEWAGEVVATGVRDPGDVEACADALARARELGAAL